MSNFWNERPARVANPTNTSSDDAGVRVGKQARSARESTTSYRALRRDPQMTGLTVVLEHEDGRIVVRVQEPV